MIDPSSILRPPSKVLILFNGSEPQPLSSDNPENHVFPEGVRLVMQALGSNGFEVSAFNIEDDVDRMIAAIVVASPKIVFNLVEQLQGDDTQLGLFAGFLELLGVDFTGSTALTLASCRDRVRTHLLLQDAKLPVPGFVTIRDLKSLPDVTALRFPVVVTQAFDDAYEYEGLHFPIQNHEQLAARAQHLSGQFDLPFLVEEYITGRHIHAIVIGNTVPTVLPLTESIVPARSLAAALEINDIQSPLPTPTMRTNVLANLSASATATINQIAIESFRATDCRDWAQIDFRIADDDQPVVIDVRPMLDLGENQAFHVAATHSQLGLFGVISQIAKR